ncbi:uncharacterized protein SCHCODRAFT_02545345, partial [Schizophyllum commune H4-8]|uniref:uncharacterized protein n=1 Tax=Schizophyllum commune (strain H4-8 / FGSC 9210) TaxID=578458 RepID=UPI00215FA974
MVDSVGSNRSGDLATIRKHDRAPPQQKKRVASHTFLPGRLLVNRGIGSQLDFTPG